MEMSSSTQLPYKFFAYLGAILMLSGVGAYYAMFWQEMSSNERILGTLGVGFILYLIALCSQLITPESRINTPLFLIGAFLETSGLFVSVHELGWDWKMQDTSLNIYGVMLIQTALTFLITRRTSVLFCAMSFYLLFAGTLLYKLEVDSDLISLAVGTSLLCFNYFVQKSGHSSMAGFWYLLGSSACLGGAFNLLREQDIDVLFIGLATALMYISTVLGSRAMLFSSCAGLLSYIAYFTARNFVDSLGWPIALMCMGFLLIGGSYLGNRIIDCREE